MNKDNSISQISNKLDRLSASVESLIDSSTSKSRELSEKIDVLFQNQEEIRRQQYEDKADNIRENILNFAEQLRNHPDGEYSIEKFEQIFALGSPGIFSLKSSRLTPHHYILFLYCLFIYPFSKPLHSKQRIVK